MSAVRSWRFRALAEPLLASVALMTIVTCAHLSPRAAASGTRPGAPEHRAADSEIRSTDTASTDIQSSTRERAGNTAAVEGADNRGLALWSKAVRAVRAGQRTEPLRILWFGDSHSAADYWPSAVRKALASELPSAGPGYLALGVPSYRHGMARLWQAGGLEVSPHPPARRNAEDDGIFGLGGTRVTMKDPSAFVSLKLAFEGAADSTVGYELYYRATNGTDRILLSVGTDRRELGQGDATTTVGGLSVTRFDSSGKQAIEIRALRGKPQLFGIVAESRRPGLVIDTLGINGARFGTFLAWERESFQSLVAQRSPLIAVVAYGTNEVYDGEPVARHAARLEQVIERLRAAVPDIGCIVAGPTDAGKGGEAATSRVVALDQAERSTAERIGCAYFSPFDVMSADGGFQSWRDREPPLALSDGIHLTAHGYNRLGDELAKRCLTVDGR